jgi:chitodextrinase
MIRIRLVQKPFPRVREFPTETGAGDVVWATLAFVRVWKMKRFIGVVALLLAASVAYAQTDVLVQRGDDARTGQNLNEPTLVAPNVNVGTFGKLYSFAVDGYTYAQPLYKSNLTIPGKGTFNVVFVATEHGSVFAFDADAATPLWQASFINPNAGITPQPSADTGPGNTDIVPEVSITSTPVIDPASGTLYVVAKTQEGGTAVYRIHALDVTTGAQKVIPTVIQASVPKTGGGTVTFNANFQQQRPGLVFLNGIVYVAFGSSGDTLPWAGWVLAYSGTTLAQTAVFCASASGVGAGVWAGTAPAVDANGNVFLAAANGSYNGSTDWGNTFLKFSTASGLTVTDYFTQFNQAAQNAANLDLSTAGPVLLPDAVGTQAHPHLMVGSGKDGAIYLVDRDNMGRYNPSVQNTQIVQWIPNQLGTSTVAEGNNPLPYVENNYSTAGYWQNRVYFCGVDDHCKMFTLSNGLLSTTPTSQTAVTFAYSGAEPVVSAASSSATTGIMWAVQRDTTNNIAVLHAYDATNLASELYNSNQAANHRDTAGPPVKFVVPTVINGKVFVGAQSEIDVYGLLASSSPRLAAPTFAPASGSYTAAQSITLSASSGASIYYTLDGSLPTLSSRVYTGAIAVSATTTLNAIAVQSGFLTSLVAAATYTIGSSAPIAYVQGNNATPQTPQSSVAVRFTAVQQQGDLNVVAVGWNDSTSTIGTVTDSIGNAYRLAVGPTIYSGAATQAIYYAANIASAAAGANTVTVSFNASVAYPDIRILEYTGVSGSNPLDVTAAATGNGTFASSGAATTTSANDLIFGADVTVSYTTAAGSGFQSRMITSPDGDIAEDRIVTATGSYAATAPTNPADPWIMQMAAFKAGAGGAAIPTAPANLTATAASSSQISLTWGAATETGGTIAQYLIERCRGAGCSSFTQIGTSTTLSFTDSGLTGSTSYSYRVRARDASGNTGPYSGTATASTLAGVPTAPTNLAATAAGSTQVNLTWGASSESGGSIALYLIERCQGAGCSSFTQVGTATGTSFSDSALSASTTYSYRVRAQDASGTNGPYSNLASATTTGSGAPTAPGNLAATAAGANQIGLTWGAATESGGTIALYLIERCQGAGCSSFTQIGTSTTLSFSDSGLTGSTSYSYRVRAQDASGTTGPYSGTATASTLAGVPTAPTNLAATAAGSTQVGLTWGASSESGGSIALYLIERCQGSGCSGFAQIGTSTTLSFSDSGLAGSTSYSYRVRAQDSGGSTGPYSGVATASTAAPVLTAPSNLAASAAGSSQINLTWSAASETGGTISAYLIERCQGAGCSTFTQVASTAGTSFNDTGLTATTAYSYRVRATDAAGDLGPYSNIASATTASGSVTPITFVQKNYATPQTPQNSVAVRFTSAQQQGDLNVVVVGWNDATSTIGTVTDSSGNVYQLAVGPTVYSGTGTQAIYYCANIIGATANANTVTVAFNASVAYPDIRTLEYSGVDTTSPLDVTAAATGNGTSASSGAATTTYANDLIFGADLTVTYTSGAGAGFTSRVITDPDSDIAEDKIVTATGSYAATAPIGLAGAWIMQMAAFRKHP